MAIKRQMGLGRGLNAIFDFEATDDTGALSSSNVLSNGEVKLSVGAVTELELSKIDPNPEQPRSNFDSSTIEELAQSIASLGIIQPLTVREGEYGRYVIISGERRYKAARMAGLVTVPVYVRKVNDQKLLEMALVENIQREDLNPLEIAISLERLIVECKITQETLSERVGKNRATISNYIRLLKLPSRVQLSLSSGGITMGHAKALLSVDSENVQEMILDNIIRNALSVRQTEQAIKSLIENNVDGGSVVPERRSVGLSPSVKHFEDSLKLLFGPKVSIKQAQDGKGRVVIEFNEDEMEELSNRLKSLTHL